VTLEEKQPERNKGCGERWLLKRRLRWGAGIFVIGAVLRGCAALLGSGTDFQVETSALGFGGKGITITITITNIAKEAVTVTDLIVNDRSDCKVSRSGIVNNNGYAALGQVPTKSTLKVGDQMTWSSGCNVVRVTVKTDQGSDTFDRKYWTQICPNLGQS